MADDRIRLKIVSDRHFVASFARPGRIEVSADDEGNLIAHIYEGAVVDMDQEPLIAFDSTVECEDCEG